MRELRMNATSISRDGLISQRSPWRRGPATDGAAAANHWSTAYLRSSFALLRFVLLTTGKLFRRPTRPSTRSRTRSARQKKHEKQLRS